MQNKIDIPGTSITLEIVDKNITITNKIEYDMQMHFRNTDADASLDTSGDVFEPLYWLRHQGNTENADRVSYKPWGQERKRHLAELQKFFEFIENNKRNLFDLVVSRRITMKTLTLSLDISTTATGWAVFHGSDLVQSGVLKHKSKSFFERGRFMASELRTIQSRGAPKVQLSF